MQRIIALSNEDELQLELAETREALATVNGMLIESHRTRKLFMTVCNCHMAVNVFLFFLLLAIGLKWI